MGTKEYLINLNGEKQFNNELLQLLKSLVLLLCDVLMINSINKPLLFIKETQIC